MERTLVTGASGYVGQHLVRALLDAGTPVRGFAGRPQPESLAGCEWVQGDIRDLDGVRHAVEGCEVVVHLACLPMDASKRDPERAIAVNVTGTLHVLEAARAAGVRQVVYTSTAQVYGIGAPLPVPEDAPPRPGEPYAATKLCGEILCTTFARSYGLSITVLRPFNVYGPALDGTPRPTVEAIFARRVANGEPPLIKSDPTEGRDFIHVSDVVRALRLAATGRGAGEAINVGSGRLTTLGELAGMVTKIGSGQATDDGRWTMDDSPVEPVSLPPSSIVHRPSSTAVPSAAAPMRLRADTTRARRILGFEARVSLEDGIRELLEIEHRARTED